MQGGCFGREDILFPLTTENTTDFFLFILLSTGVQEAGKAELLARIFTYS
jgi:hypothetical protein